MKKSILIFVSALLAISTTTYAGPFGLDMGTPLAELNKLMKLKLEKTALYSTPSVPKPHPDFDDYRLVVTPNHGLCKVIAWSRIISTSVYGTELVNKFSDVESALNAKYGASKRYDFLRSGSIWNEPRDWTMGLLKKERTLTSYWTNEAHELPENVETIELQAMAIGTEQAMIRLGYEFKNSSQCIDWIKSQKDSSL